MYNLKIQDIGMCIKSVLNFLLFILQHISPFYLIIRLYCYYIN